MTPDPATIEQAARELCRLRGIDPDANVHLLLHSPAWQRAAPEVSKFMQLQAACEHAQRKPTALPFTDGDQP